MHYIAMHAAAVQPNTNWVTQNNTEQIRLGNTSEKDKKQVRFATCPLNSAHEVGNLNVQRCRTQEILYMQSKKASLEVLYNANYGKFNLNDIVLQKFNQRKMNKNKYWKPIWNITNVERHDPILVELYHEYGSRFQKGSNVKIMIIPRKYEHFYHIEEINGMEKVIIDYDKYKLHKIKTILFRNIINDEKIKEIIKIFS